MVSTITWQICVIDYSEIHIGVRRGVTAISIHPVELILRVQAPSYSPGEYTASTHCFFAIAERFLRKPISMSVRNQRIAVVGSGVSGLATAWLLQYHGAQVTLFESEERCGGHTLTDHTSGTPVDLGFQVFNLTTYPHFVSWLEHLGVDSEASDMSFAISVDGGKLEWASHGLNTIFAQRKNIFDLSFLRMVREVLRFGREAPKVLKEENEEKYRDVTLGQYLQAQGYAWPYERTAS